MRGKLDVWAGAILLGGALLRVVALDRVPSGLNQDEASIGVEALSLALYGADRHGVPWPVHLIAWGSGQNALYAYLLAPIVAVFGLTVTTVRVVNATFGCLAIVAAFFIGRQAAGTAGGRLFALVVALSPWHLMATRWGLESNLFPNMALLAVALLLRSDRSTTSGVAAAVLFAGCLYAYGTALLWMVPFLALVCALAWSEQIVRPKKSAVMAAAFIVVATPILAFYATNLFHLGHLAIGPLNLPILPSTPRYSEVYGILGDGDRARFIAEQFRKAFSFTFGGGNDGLPYNAMPDYGTMPWFSLPFFLMGMAWSLRRPGALRRVSLLFLAWLIAALAVIGSANMNINRMNIAFFPILFFVAMGFAALSAWSIWLGRAGALLIVLSAAPFLVDYFTAHADEAAVTSFAGLGEAIDTEARHAGPEEPIVVLRNQLLPYIFLLFYDPTTLANFSTTVQYDDPHAPFRTPRQFGRYHYVSSTAQGPYSRHYLFHKTDEGQFPRSAFDVHFHGSFGVAERR